MPYKKLKSYRYTEAELREIWSETYCEKVIVTFDNIVVKFYSGMFDHCFFESDDRLKKDKSLLSFNRLEKIYWIKEALEDPDAILKKGWISKLKSYDNNRRVTIVKGNYIVVIQIYAANKARFITAYEVNDNKNLELILNSPDWT
ncbi:MAG: hypothetical protein COW63_00615 [Bacteroidetes bacterium CG18_big_fil_WC_8_21_14_2_50_41_14]|nr:MAG: hypothetical protein COW63_00615 [Bacteroidetes bacterium CG18_big_fil_WC_8_21_14_2_50_41_14]PJB57378.1 MAG: hypothetical protein CO098_11820 [Bacteroidetes bacterium CG_4_9_14_3_um_filter_41_19]